ncbi:hypothetical protein D9756_008254 [Leucocoprinus leucothites]|uniref:DUF6534 domain-containing protein n=1 Tax=Leucocoprinus leucothites TaxID=201217 RepID=A0A8H5CZZ3_9AGAR|nr:hypothetical protein D9756_008254 [Leucoagaricus leucothites]
MGVRNSATAQFFGLIFNWALYGTLFTQVYTYHVCSPKDKLVYKVIVYGIFLLENAQTATLTYGVYDSLIIHFGDPIAAESVQLTWFAVPLCSGIISFVAHMVYVYRVHRLSRSFWITSAVLLQTLVQPAIAIVVTVYSHNARFFNLFEYTSHSILVAWSFSEAACDVGIAICMTYCLIKCDPGRLERTTKIITRLIRLVIETGMATAILGILNATLFVALPGNEDFNIPAFILSKSYSNALLRLLNSRTAIRNECNRESEHMISPVQFARSGSRSDQYPRSDRTNNDWGIPQLEPTFHPSHLATKKCICIRRETAVFTDSDTPGYRAPPSPLSSASSE